MDCNEKGLVEQTKIGEAVKQADNRKQTGDTNGQRPVATKSTVKTNKGSFTFKG